MCMRCWGHIGRESSVSWKRSGIGKPPPLLSQSSLGEEMGFQGMWNTRLRHLPCAIFLCSGPIEQRSLAFIVGLSLENLIEFVGHAFKSNDLVLLIYFLLEINRYSKFSLGATTKWHIMTPILWLIDINKSYFPTVSHKCYNETLLNKTTLLEGLLYLDVKLVFWYLGLQDIWLEMKSKFLKMDPIIHKEFTQLFIEFPEEFYLFNLHSCLNPSWTSSVSCGDKQLLPNWIFIWIIFSFIKWARGNWGEGVGLLWLNERFRFYFLTTYRAHLKIKSILKAERKLCYF